ncbi:MAG: hypothetical protein JOZ32_10590 [Bryobacterales bacterium]|nr:hypothetical protein [Bryobacterales bacterium]
MRCLSRVLIFVGLAGAAFGQGHPSGSWSLGGFGSVLYPGMGHAPTATPPIGQFAYSGYSHGFVNPGRAAHPQHGATVIVPYPVYYGGYYGYDPTAAGYANGFGPGNAPAYAPGYSDDGSQAGPGLPSVVINQNFVPPQANPQVREYSGEQQQQQQSQDQSGLKLYQAPPSHPYADAAATQGATGDQATIYLIALRDHTIVQALGYWMEGNTLHYVSAEHTLNQLSIDLVDRDLSQRLNEERHLDFRLPQAR